MAVTINLYFLMYLFTEVRRLAKKDVKYKLGNHFIQLGSITEQKIMFKKEIDQADYNTLT